MQESPLELDSFVGPSGIRWTVAEGFRPLVEEVLAPLLSGADHPPVRSRTLKSSRRRRVEAVDVPGWPSVVVKAYPVRRNAAHRLRERFWPRSSREFRTACRLQASAVPVPSPVACSEPRTADRESHYVCLELRGCSALGPYLEARFSPGDQEPWKLALVRRAGDLLMAVHERGIYHRDFHGGNVLLRLGEGPAGQLWVIDLAPARDLGTVPDAARARDLAHLLHTLRYALDSAEIEGIAARAERWELTAEQVLTALRRKAARSAASRSRRALVDSTLWCQERSGEFRVSRRRDLPLEEVQRHVEGHRQALAEGAREVVRYGRRSALTRQPRADGGSVVVKEFLAIPAGSGLRRARRAWQGGQELEVRDLPVPEPLALLAGPARSSSFLVYECAEDFTPLHLLASRPAEMLPASSTRRLGARLAELLLRMIDRGVLHSDLSAKNVLVGPGPDGGFEVLLVDWDAVTVRAWTRRRLTRALVQLGDLPPWALSRSERLRFLRRVLQGLDREAELGEVARSTEALLRRRRRLDSVLEPR